MPESTHYPLADAATAIRVMSGAEHTGKLVLDVPHTGRSRVVVPPEQAPGLPRRRRLHHHRRPGWPRAVPRREDGRGGLRPDRALPRARSQRQRRWRRSSASARSVPTSWWSAATSPNPARRDRLVAAATATGLPVRGVLHAAAVVEDATLTNITDELIERDWAPKVYGAWNLHTGHRRPAVGLVLLVLLGGRAGGLARAGRLRRGQQLAGRLHPLAPGSGPAGDRDRLGRLGRDRARHRPGGRRRRRHRSRRGRVRVRSAAAPRPRLHRICADHRAHRG